jgi:hypothetical protein
MPKTKPDTRLSGVIVQAYAPKQRGKWSITDFVLKSNDGKDLKVSKFGGFEKDMVGELVSFDANYSAQYKTYSVVGDIVTDSPQQLTVGSVVPAANTQPSPQATIEPTPATPKRRGRPKKQEVVIKAKMPEPVTAVPSDPKADLYEEAKATVQRNLKAAETLAISIGKTDSSLKDLVALGDMIGRTYVALRIESNKDRRMNSFKR